MISELKTLVKPYSNDKHALNRLFSYQECYAFTNCKELGFQITQEISDFFDINFRSIHFVGSSQLGHSFAKNTPFEEGVSDLDVAIVNSNLYLQYLEKINVVTKSFNSLDKFTNHGLLSPNEVAEAFKLALAKGYFRPDYMPVCDDKYIWDKFFNDLSSKYAHKFKKITCGIYVSQAVFNMKQKFILNRIRRSG